MASHAANIFTRGRRVYIGILLLAAALLAVELAAKAVIVWKLGIEASNYGGYYLHDKNLNLLTRSLKYSPHPYFGYESAAIRRFEAERDGRSKEDYVIGVLGGSVAEIFADYAGRHPQHFEPLRGAFPELRDKRLVIANLALGGGRQPQQYFIASFFLEDVDLFISIEGLNETQRLSFLPVYPLEFPGISMTHYERTSRGRGYRWLAAPLRRTYQGMNRLPVRFQVLSRSHAYFLFWHLASPVLFASVRQLDRLYYNAVMRYEGGPEGRSSANDLLERKVHVWRRYARLQDRLINGTAGKQVFLFLHPNQYVRGSKRFSELERTTAIDPSRFAHVDPPMQRFKEEIRALNEQGVRAYDLTGIFRETADTVYIDRCCHVNDLGNEIMAKAIVSRIADHETAKKRAPSKRRAP